MEGVTREVAGVVVVAGGLEEAVTAAEAGAGGLVAGRLVVAAVAAAVAVAAVVAAAVVAAAAEPATGAAAGGAGLRGAWWVLDSSALLTGNRGIQAHFARDVPLFTLSITCQAPL
jgi:hypothetical protein